MATAGNKRQKLVQQQQQQPQKPLTETPVIEPTLTPVHPEPLPPTTRTAATADELAFFERVRKYFGNKSVFGEFLKLCNLFNQQLIDRDVLIYKAAQFLGNNAELMNTFKQMVSYKTEDEPVENKPEPPTGKVSLSNCRGYGPSYRLLPKRVSLCPSLSLR